MTSTPSWFMHVPVISTVHMDPATNQRLLVGENLEGNEIVSLEGGWLCYVGEVEEFPDDYPADLMKILLWAKNEEFEWVRLDQDGDEIDALPQYDW